MSFGGTILTDIRASGLLFNRSSQLDRPVLWVTCSQLEASTGGWHSYSYLKVEASYVFEATYLAPSMGLGPLRAGVQ